MKLIPVLFVICLFAYLLILAQSASGQTMENGMYTIQDSNIETVNTDLNISNTNLNSSLNESKPGKFSGVNYTVKSGAHYSPNTIPFTFSISNTFIDFGALSPTNPVSRTSTIGVKNKYPLGYKVMASENHQLIEAKNGSIIPDTTCDDGKCTQSLSSKWDSTLTYGLGYRCDSAILTCTENDDSFVYKNFYKQFSDSSIKESAAIILSRGSSLGQDATLIYKVNISSTQPQGIYSNVVTFLAVPTY